VGTLAAQSPSVLFRKDRTLHRRKPLAGVSGGGLFRFGSKGAAWFNGRVGPAQLKTLTLGMYEDTSSRFTWALDLGS